MKTRFGLALAHDSVRAVAVRGKHVVWAAEAPREEGQELQATIASLLEAAPSSSWRRPVLSAAVGPHASQVKLLNGIPEVTDPAMLAAIVRESVGTFFLKADSPLLTTGARPIGSRSALAAAIELDSVAAIRDACRSARWRLGCIAPTAVVLPMALETELIVWRDGSIVLEIGSSGQALESVRTRPFDALNPPAVQDVPAPGLAALGDKAAGFADAYGAAVLDLRETLALDPETAGWWTEGDRRRRTRVLATVAGLGVVCLLLSPLGATWARHRADARADAVRPGQWKVIASSLEQLRRVTASLEDLRRFTAARSSATRTLGALTGALPDGNILLDLEIAGDRMQMVALSLNPVELLSAVRALPESRSAEFTGALSRQAAGGGDFQRVTIRSGTAGSTAPSTEGRPQ